MAALGFLNGGRQGERKRERETGAEKTAAIEEVRGERAFLLFLFFLCHWEFVKCWN